MKFSVYNHIFKSDGETFLYNILTTALIKLDPDIVQLVQDSCIGELGDETVAAFKELGFIVESASDEMLAYKYFYDRTRYGLSSAILHFTFIPTYACNLACPYCLQGGNKNAKKIDERGVAAILSFIRRMSLNPQNQTRPEKMYITLYGGEPMLAKRELKVFCDGVLAIAREAKLPVEFDMTTNLTLLDDDMINLIQMYRIHIQASIDGTKEHHDKRRIKVDGGGTYDIIVGNLKRLVDLGLREQITIRLNVDRGSIMAADLTFKEMAKYSDDVYFAFLTPYRGVNDGYEDRCVTPDCYSAMAVQKFNKILVAHGRNVAQSFGKKSPCAINCENKYWIDCNLDVYKCELLVKLRECRAGHLTEDGMFEIEPNFYKQMCFSPFNYEKCRNCKMLPICGGGCPATTYLDMGLRNGDVSKCQCTMDDASLTEYLDDYIKRTVPVT